MVDKIVSDYDNSCADCAYHHCRLTCQENGKCTDGDCLYRGVKMKCYEKRCEHFKQWRHKE